MGKSKFQNLEDPFLLQQTLFLPSGVAPGEKYFPPILRTSEDIRSQILSNPAGGLGLDLEFNPETGRPSILGLANKTYAAAVPWDANLAREAVEVAKRAGVQFVGHSVVSADRPILDGATGVLTPLELWDCTMLRHYLVHPDLCKTPGKDEGDEDSGAMGFMNLWTMASLHTNLPAWKNCRGKACEGPCPLHDPWGYCAIDSWAGLEAKTDLSEKMRSRNIPESLHWDLMELSEITHIMETRGVRIDKEYVQEMEKNFESHKLEIFPLNERGEYTPFNPKSPAQIIQYFKDQGIGLENTDKKSVRKTLEREARRRGIDFESIAHTPNLPPELDSLFRLFEFKEAGKGLKSWFDDRYLDDTGQYIHPRFIVPGTSMGRLSSSRPNFQNIPARGFGARVRKAIIPRSSDQDLVKADYSQLEFRKMLHAAGFDPRELKADPFVGLVARSSGQMIPAAEFMHGTERDVAKSLVHAFDYFEGITVLSSKDLDRRKKEIESGALKVYLRKYDSRLSHDWEYRGGIVAFTGGNLAERLFGNKSWESRKKALALQELVADEFPMLRQLHWKILQEIEARRGVQLQTGRFLPLYGSAEDDAKMGAAATGQGGGADYVQGIMLRYFREQKQIPLLQVHDELVWEVPKTWTNDQVGDFLWLMGQEDPRMPGFISAFKAKRGSNWKEMQDIPLRY